MDVLSRIKLHDKTSKINVLTNASIDLEIDQWGHCWVWIRKATKTRGQSNKTKMKLMGPFFREDFNYLDDRWVEILERFFPPTPELGEFFAHV